jgi:heat shock protein HslJ
MRGMLYTKTVTFDLGCDRRRQVGQPDRAGAWVNRRGIFSVVSARLRLGLVGLMILFTTGASAGASVLAGSEWRPKQIGDVTLSDNTPLFVRFMDQGLIAGFDGCNNFSGDYTVADGALKITVPTQTPCSNMIAGLQVAFLQTLRSAAAFQRRRVLLALFDHNNRQIAYFAQTDWD